MKTLKYMALGLSAALALVAACGDDGGSTTGATGDGDGGGDGAGGAGGAGTNTGSTGTNAGGGATSGTNTTTGSNTTTGGNCTPAEDENTETLCGDGCDNDDDGFTDCGDENGEFSDFGCGDFCTTPGPPAENSNPTCSDGVDNDGDDLVDCDDDGCAERAACDAPVDGESAEGDPNTVCTNGIDDDDNGFTDCGDFGCSDSWEATDCQDLPQERNSNALCSNGVDDDLDGLEDCDDPGCADPETGDPREGIVVCGPDAELDDSLWAGLVAELCSDGDDNDGNGFFDCAEPDSDFGCTQNPDSPCNEISAATCDDGLDNDGNGFIDCEDFSCSQNPNVTVCPPKEYSFADCTDGVDNDGNGFSDCDDNGCLFGDAADAACAFLPEN